MGFIDRLGNVLTGANKRPDPKEYTSLLGKGSIVPCQIEAYFLALNNYLPKQGLALDVGFGLGYGLNILAIEATSVSGVEIDHQALVYCEQTIVGRNPKLSVLKIFDGYNLDFEDGSFDLVTCVDVLEHVDDYNKLVSEMLRVSKKGVFISTPNRRPEYTRKDGTPKNHWHLREWSHDELNEILQAHGHVDWNFLNGSWAGPFSRSKELMADTLTLSPFISPY